MRVDLSLVYSHLYFTSKFMFEKRAIHKTYKYFICILSMVLGGTIYLAFRNTSMLMFSWIDSLNLREEIEYIREILFSYKNYLPDFVLYTLPDGCWVFSMTSFYVLLWGRIKDFQTFFWISLASFLGLGGELGQYIGIVEGTFDIMDLIFMSICAIASYFICCEKTHQL